MKQKGGNNAFEEEKLYVCSLHKNYATYTSRDDYLAHLQLVHEGANIAFKENKHGEKMKYEKK